MTKEQLIEGKELQSQIDDYEQVIQYMDAREDAPLYWDQQGRNVSKKLPDSTNQTIKRLIRSEIETGLKQLREKFNNL